MLPELRVSASAGTKGSRYEAETSALQFVHSKQQSAAINRQGTADVLTDEFSMLNNDMDH